MDGAVMDLSVEGAETSRGVSAQQLPLTFVSAGETVKVIKVRGKTTSPIIWKTSVSLKGQRSR